MKWVKETVMTVVLLLGLALTFGAGVEVGKSAPAQLPTFRETYFIELDKANAEYEIYSHTDCTDKAFPDVEGVMNTEYKALKHLVGLVMTEEKDPIQQDHEIEAYAGFIILLKQSIEEHDACLAPNPSNSTATKGTNGSSI